MVREACSTGFSSLAAPEDVETITGSLNSRLDEVFVAL